MVSVVTSWSPSTSKNPLSSGSSKPTLASCVVAAVETAVSEASVDPAVMVVLVVPVVPVVAAITCAALTARLISEVTALVVPAVLADAVVRMTSFHPIVFLTYEFMSTLFFDPRDILTAYARTLSLSFQVAAVRPVRLVAAVPMARTVTLVT